jgi:hypothetical protein
MASETVFAARRGDRVAAMTESSERMKMMTSRFQSGQFYSRISAACSPTISFKLLIWRRQKTYKRIIGVIRRLRHQQNRARLVVLEIRITRRIQLYLPPPIALENMRGAGDMLEVVVFQDAETHGSVACLLFRSPSDGEERMRRILRIVYE